MSALWFEERLAGTKPPSRWIFNDINGDTELLLHVLKDFSETWMSFRFSQRVH